MGLSLDYKYIHYCTKGYPKTGVRAYARTPVFGPFLFRHLLVLNSVLEVTQNRSIWIYGVLAFMAIIWKQFPHFSEKSLEEL
jgi:hypothetical protein